MSKLKGRLVYALLSSLLGASLLCIFATFQKIAIGAPLVMTGYFVPVGFGSISGGVIGFYISVIKEYNVILKERVSTLESFLPICANCKNIRLPDSGTEQKDSWVPIESYFSAKTSSRFSHNICPVCMEKLYGDVLKND